MDFFSQIKFSHADARGVFLVTFESNNPYVGDIWKDVDIDILCTAFDSRLSFVSWTALFPVNGNAASDSSPGNVFHVHFISSRSLSAFLSGSCFFDGKYKNFRHLCSVRFAWRRLGVCLAVQVLLARLVRR